MSKRVLERPMGFTSAGDDFDKILSSLSFDNSAEADLATVTTSTRAFGIRPADSEGRRHSASMLINKMYAWRGYGTGFSVGDRPDQMSLVAADYHLGTAIGTLTVGLDRKDGLLADRLYHAEAQQLRGEGCRVCEMIKFAVERSLNSKHLLAALFHVAFIYAYRLQGCSDLLVEVTPEHAIFYRHLLHFQVLGGEKLNPRVNTMGVLLRLNLDYAAEQIRRFGGQGKASLERSLYPYAFSQREERGVIERLKRIELAPPSRLK